MSKTESPANTLTKEKKSSSVPELPAWPAAWQAPGRRLAGHQAVQQARLNF
jgi:hypothetical protein